MPEHPIRVPAVRGVNSFLSYLVRYLPEGASQTFPVGSPLIPASGLLVESTSPLSTTNKVYAIAMRAGQNTTGATAEVVLAVPGLLLFANLLGDAAADHTLVATNLGVKYDFHNGSAILADGGDAWYVAATTDEGIAQVVSLDSDYHPHNTPSNTRAVVGDVNPRVEVVFDETILALGS